MAENFKPWEVAQNGAEQTDPNKEQKPWEVAKKAVDQAGDEITKDKKMPWEVASELKKKDDGDDSEKIQENISKPSQSTLEELIKQKSQIVDDPERIKEIDEQIKAEANKFQQDASLWDDNLKKSDQWKFLNSKDKDDLIDMGLERYTDPVERRFMLNNQMANQPENYQREYTLEQEIKHRERVVESDLEDMPPEMAKYVRGERQSKIDSLKNELRSMREQEIKNNYDQYIQLEEQLATIDKDDDTNREVIERQMAAIKLQLDNVFASPEQKVTQLIEEGEIVPEEGKSAKQMLEDYYYGLLAQREFISEDLSLLGNLADDIRGTAVDLGDRAMKLFRGGNPLGASGLPESDVATIQKFNAVQDKIDALTPIVALNRYGDYSPREGWKGLFDSTVKSFNRFMNIGLEGDMDGPEGAMSVIGTFNELGITEKVNNGYDLLTSARYDHEKERFVAPDFWTVESGGDLLGMVGAMAFQMRAGAGTANALAGNFKWGRNFIKFADRGGDITKYLNSTKVFKNLEKTSTWGKALNKSAKWGAGALKSGAEYEITGEIFSNNEEEFNFGSGMLGFVGRSLTIGAGQLGNNIFGKVAPMFPKVFGKGTKDAVRAIARYGKVGAKLHTYGAGETFEELAQELYQIHRRSNGDFFENLDQQFGDFDEAMKFVASTYVMGISFGAAKLGSIYREVLYPERLSELSSDKQAKVEAFVKKANGDIQESVEGAIESDEKLSNTTTEEVSNNDGQQTKGSGEGNRDNEGGVEETEEVTENEVIDLINEVGLDVNDTEAMDVIRLGLKSKSQRKVIKAGVRTKGIVEKFLGQSVGLKLAASESDIKKILKAAKGKVDKIGNAFIYTSSDGAREIVVDINKMRENTIFHELYHPVLDVVEKTSPEAYKDLVEIAKKRIKVRHQGRAMTFDEWSKEYYKGKKVQENEALTEFLATVAAEKEFSSMKPLRDFYQAIVNFLKNNLNINIDDKILIDLENNAERVAEKLVDAFVSGKEFDILNKKLPKTKEGVNFQAQEVFHGSPYEFSNFSKTRIDSKNQMGWGVYFSNQKDVARWYAEQGGADARRNIYNSTIETDNFVEYYKDMPEELADKLAGTLASGLFKRRKAKRFANQTVGETYRELENKYGSEKASFLFHKVGLDGFSDTTGEKTNYVVFPFKEIPIEGTIQYQATETKEFKEWFGDSKVVNEDGSPKVVYHGTQDGSFDVFNDLSFFTEKMSEADSYASTLVKDDLGQRKERMDGSKVHEVFLSIKNPVGEGTNVNVSHLDVNLLGNRLSDAVGSSEGLTNRRNELLRNIEQWKKEGYDGIKTRSDEGSLNGKLIYQWIPFYPNQIKSALSNNGDFSRDDNRIQYQIIGESEMLTNQVKDNLALAKDMRLAGRDPLDIRLATGWEVGADNQWKYEISDGTIVKTESGTYKLKEVLDNPELYKYHPDMQDLEVKLDVREHGAESGWYFPAAKEGEKDSFEINVKNPRNIHTYLVHELQHHIQFKDWFAVGGNEQIVLDKQESILSNSEKERIYGLKDNQRIIDKMSEIVEYAMDEHEGVKTSKFFTEQFLNDNFSDVLDDVSAEEIEDYVLLNEELDIKLSKAKREGGYEEVFEVLYGELNAIRDELSIYAPYNIYQRLAGEVESRNVERRLRLTPQERRKTTLEKTEDTPRDLQIILTQEAIEGSIQYQNDPRTEIEKQEDQRKDRQYRMEIEGKFISEGDNYVFRHYSHNPKKTLEGRTSIGSLKTSRDETSALNSVGGVTLYYTQEGQKEGGVGSYRHEIAVPKDKVYIFNSDADGLYWEARDRFHAKFPGQGFSANHQVAWITKVANERGYEVVVARWKKNEWRGQGTSAIEPRSVINEEDGGSNVQFQYEGYNKGVDRLEDRDNNHPALVQFQRDDEKAQPRAEGDKRISQRITSAKGRLVDDPHGTSDLGVTMSVAERDLPSYVKNAFYLTEYDLIKPFLDPDDVKALGKTVEEHGRKSKDEYFSGSVEAARRVYNAVKEQIKDNLKWLHDQYSEEIRAEAKRWYEGANRVANEFAAKYGYATEQIAGAIAAMSPQKDWFMNIALAERVASIMKLTEETFDDKMLEWAEQKFIEAKTQALKDYNNPKKKKSTPDVSEAAILAVETARSLVGKKLADMNSFEKAVFVRAWDESYNRIEYYKYLPGGDRLGFARKKDGDVAKAAWGSYSEIESAVRILEDGSFENISQSLGTKHKIRNFYNNIIDPNSLEEDVTMDTHAIAAALIQALSGNSGEVSQNFGTSKGKFKYANNGKFGNNGIYALFADSYREAASELGLLPRELQSITWEAIRGLFEAKWKNSDKNVKKVREIWSKFNGKNKDKVRDDIKREAGGISEPVWWSDREYAKDVAEGKIEPDERELLSDVIFARRSSRGSAGRNGGNDSGRNKIQEQRGSVSAAPYRYRNVTGLQEVLTLDNTPVIQEYKQTVLGWADKLGINVERLIPNLGGYKNSWEYSITPVVDGNQDAIKAFAALLGSMGPEVQESTVVSIPRLNGAADNVIVNVKPELAQELLDNLYKYNVGGFSFDIEENRLYIYDIVGEEVKTNELYKNEADKIDTKEDYKATVKFVEEGDYASTIAEFRKSRYYQGIKDKELEGLLIRAERRASGNIQQQADDGDHGFILNRTAMRIASTPDKNLDDLRADILLNPQNYGIQRMSFTDANSILDEMTESEKAKAFEKGVSLKRAITHNDVSKNLGALAGISLMSDYVQRQEMDKAKQVFDKLWQMGSHAGLILRQMAELKGTTAQSIEFMVIAQLGNLGLNPPGKRSMARLMDLAFNWEMAKKKLDNIKKDINRLTQGDISENKDLLENLIKEAEEAFVAFEGTNVELNRHVNGMLPLKLRALYNQILQGNLLTMGSISVNIFANIWYNMLFMRPFMEFVSDVTEWTFTDENARLRNYKDHKNFFLHINGSVTAVDFETWYNNEEYWSKEDKEGGAYGESIEDYTDAVSKMLSRRAVFTHVGDVTMLEFLKKNFGKRGVSLLRKLAKGGLTNEEKSNIRRELGEISAKLSDSKKHKLFLEHYKQAVFMSKAKKAGKFPFSRHIAWSMLTAPVAGIGKGVQATFESSIIGDLFNRIGEGVDSKGKVRNSKLSRIFGFDNRRAVGDYSGLERYDIQKRMAPILALSQLKNDIIYNIQKNKGGKITKHKQLPIGPDGTTPLWLWAEKISEGFLGLNADVMFRLLSLGDVPFRYMAEMATARRIAHQKGVSNSKKGKKEFDAMLRGLTPQERNLIQRAGDAATFADDRLISKLAVKLFGGIGGGLDHLAKQGPGMNVIATIAGVIVKSAMPFVRIPANLMQAIFELAIPAIPAAGAVYYAGKDNRKAGEHLSKIFLSAALYTLAGWLYELGALVGEPRDDDDQRRQSAKYANGPNTINLSMLWRAAHGMEPEHREDDTRIEFYKAGLVGMFMAYYVKLRETLDDGGDEYDFNLDTIQSVGTAAPKSIMPQSFLANAFNVMQSFIEGNGEGFMDIGVTMTKTVIPNNLTSFQRSRRDDVLTSKDRDALKKVDKKITLSLFANPEQAMFTEERIYPIVDDLGMNVGMTQEGTVSWFEHLFSPARIKRWDNMTATIRAEQANIILKTMKGGGIPEYSQYGSRVGKDRILIDHENFTDIDGNPTKINLRLTEGDQYYRSKIEGTLNRANLITVMFDESGELSEEWNNYSITEKLDEFEWARSAASKEATNIIKWKIIDGIDAGMIKVDQRRETYEWIAEPDHVVQMNNKDWDKFGNDVEAIDKRVDEAYEEPLKK